MKRIELWIRDAYWPTTVASLGLVVLLIFWSLSGVSIYRWNRDSNRKVAAYERRYPRSLAKEKAVREYAAECAKHAKKIGPAYSPEHYFADLGQVLLRSRGQIRPQFEIDKMLTLMRENLDARRFSRHDLDLARERHHKQLNVGPWDDEQETPLPPWQQVLWWVVGRYSRFMWLALGLYILRMVNNKGILETILADKWAFVIALLVWPKRFLDYPGSNIREIQVEAELRRILGPFRRLNPTEYATIRRIASAPDFRKRLADLRKAHQVEYQRGLVVAMLATLFCLMFLPRATEARPAKTKADPQGVVMAMARAGPTIGVMLASDSGPPSADPGDRATIPDVPEVLVLGSEPLDFRDQRPPRQDVARRIDHVPVFVLVVICRFLTGRQRGASDEYVARGRSASDRDVPGCFTSVGA